MRIKYVFVDLEGTLVYGSVMEYLLKRLDKKRFEKYCELEEKLHLEGDRKYIMEQLKLFEGLRVEDIAKEVRSAPFRKGIAEGIKLFKKHGLKVVLLTDVIDVICESIKQIFGFDDMICSLTSVRDGVIEKVVQFNIYKERALESYMRKNGIKGEESIHIGDWVNDIPIFEMVKYGIAFMPSEAKLAYYASVTINIDNFELLAKMVVNALLLSTFGES